MRYSSRQLEKLQQKQEQFYPVPWVPEVFFSFISFFQFVIHDGLKKTARKKKKNSGTLPNGYFIVHVVTLRTDLWR